MSKVVLSTHECPQSVEAHYPAASIELVEGYYAPLRKPGSRYPEQTRINKVAWFIYTEEADVGPIPFCPFCGAPLSD